jgi:hypothetical protein
MKKRVPRSSTGAWILNFTLRTSHFERRRGWRSSPLRGAGAAGLDEFSFGEGESGAGGVDGSGNGGVGFGVGDDRKAGVEARREREGFAAELAVVHREHALLSRRDHLALGGNNQGVVVPDSGLGDACSSEDRDVGVDVLQGLFAQGADEHAEAVVNGASGHNGLHGADFAEESGDGEGIGDNLESLGGEEAGHGVGRGTSVEDDGHAGLDPVRDQAGNGELFGGHALVARDEVVFAGHFIGFNERRSAMVSAQNALGLQFVQRASHGGERDRKARREGVQIGVAVVADVLLDEVEALLVGHGDGARSRWKRSR